MKIITSYPVIRISGGKAEKIVSTEQISNARGGGGGRGGRGGGARSGGGARRSGGGGHRGGGFRRPRFYGGGGYYWNGIYWIDNDGLCYTKNWLGQYVLVNCSATPSVALGL